MKISARNQLVGVIEEIKKGPVSTEVTLDVNGVRIVSTITTTSADSLELAVGDKGVAIIKASSVMIGKMD